ncbi:MAG: Asp23/Gls24 family envelope stress response protein [Lentisphaeria bacterium]|nr:Asp23/Gls24 family envelope stress response protein [Lentisphaeria bacterium]
MSDIKNDVDTKHETMILEDSEMGDIRIHESVIASLARRATLSVEGVSRLSGNSLVDNLAEMVGSRRIQSRNVSIMLGDDNDVAIEVKIALKFGYCIPKIATEVQKAVIAEVESTTGMNVTGVHVLIQEIEEEDQIAKTADDNEAAE